MEPSVSNGIAIVGASDRSIWTSQALWNIEHGYDGEIWLINPRNRTVCGRDTLPSLAEIEGSLDAVVVSVPPDICAEVVCDAVRLGAQDIVVISDGFAERGAAGLALQDELVAACGPSTRLYGPNGIGFADYRRNMCVIAEPVTYPARVGEVSVVSQSGGLLAAVMAGVLDDGGGLDWCVSLGNAAQFDLAAAIDYICDRGTSTVACLYIETLPSADGRLGRALARAAEQGITTVALKPGRTAQAARIALTHTASMVGQDSEVDAFFASYGVIRAETLEELARVAALAPFRARCSARGGVVVVGSSGGTAALASDLASRDGMRLAEISADTRAFLDGNAGPGSFLENPFDFVGNRKAAVGIVGLCEAIMADPSVDLAIAPYAIVFPDYDSPGGEVHRRFFESVAEASRRTDVPTVFAALAQVPWTRWMDDFRAANPHVLVLRGLAGTIKALSRLFGAEPVAEVVNEPARSGRVLGEVLGRAALASLKLPLARGVVLEEEGARAALGSMSPPFVVKLDLKGVSHKSALGAVTLNCASVAEADAAAGSMHATIAAAGLSAADLAGTLVEEQVAGQEVLVGLSRSELGAFLTLGAGGAGAKGSSPSRTVYIATGGQTYDQTMRQFLSRDLWGTPGEDQLSRAVARLADEFVSGSLTGCESVEINPFIVNSERAVIADVLLVVDEE
jgi:acetate---CoA ligase (ADP-forming)